jgi:hypothetical protein
MKFNGIPPQAHGYLDYSYAPLVWLAPKLAGFENDKASVQWCRAVSLVTIGYSLLTNYPLGAVKKIPYKAHAVVDLAAGLFNLAAPWLLKIEKDKAARNTLLAMGAVGVVVGILSLMNRR